MGIMYTKEGHRKKGYAVDVSIDLAEKVINRGKIPFLQIVEGNNLSPGLATKCGFIPHGNSDWFGIISGCPKELKEVSEVSKEMFLKGLSDELKDILNIHEHMENHMYYALYNLKKNNFKIEDFRIKEVEEHQDTEKWCDIVANTHSVNGEIEEAKRELFNTVNREDTPYKLYLGYHRDKEVSALCTLKADDDVCGVYLISTISEIKREDIKKATILEALKIEVEKNRLELAIMQTSKNELKLFEELGFYSVTIN
jgi:molybdopterin-biosynthesis enzyme MoeA-like protein